MKKFVFLFLLISAFIFSEEGFLESPPPNPVEVVARYLNLSEEQVELWLGILDDFRISQNELINQIRPLEENLRNLLNSGNPEPQEVGNLVIKIDLLRKEMKENEEIYRDNFKALLNEEQLEKYVLLKSAFKLAPLFPAFQETRLI